MRTYYEIMRFEREMRNLNQEDIASVLGTTQQVYSRYENGDNEMPIRHLITLAKYYQITADYLMGISDKK